MRKRAFNLFQRTGLRVHLVALVAAALLPAIAVGALAVGAALASYRQAFDDRLGGTARALASAVNTEIASYVIALSALATARGFDTDGDIAAVHPRAQQVAALLGTRIFVVAPDLSVVMHSMFPIGTSLPGERQVVSMEVAQRAFETGLPAVGNGFKGRVTGRTIAPIFVPVIRDDHVTYAIGIAVESARMSRLLADQRFAAGGYAALVDGGGMIMARSSEAEAYIGKPVRDWVISGARAAEMALIQGPNYSNVRVISAVRRVSSAPGWFVVFAEPVAGYHASLREALGGLAIGAMGALAIALGAAVVIGRRIMRPVVWLTEAAERVVASGGAADIRLPPKPAQVGEFLRLTEAVLEAQKALRQRAADIAEGEARLRAIVDTAVDAIVVTDEAGTIQSFNRAAEDIFGYPAEEATGENVAILFEAEAGTSHESLVTSWLVPNEPSRSHVQEMAGMRKDGSLVPIDLALAQWQDADGHRFFTSIMRDISARRTDEVRKALLMREVDHRAKNALAVVQSVVRLTPPGEPRIFAASILARVDAIARAHSLLSEGGWFGADLRSVVERELAPHSTLDPTPGGASWDGPPFTLSAAAVQPLAIILHELATNAAKQGGLSCLGGTIEVQWSIAASMLLLSWSEAGGPIILGPPVHRGFGTRLIDTTVRGQLGGSVTRRWLRTGVVVEIEIPLAQITAKPAEVPRTRIRGV